MIIRTVRGWALITRCSTPPTLWGVRGWGVRRVGNPGGCRCIEGDWIFKKRVFRREYYRLWKKTLSCLAEEEGGRMQREENVRKICRIEPNVKDQQKCTVKYIHGEKKL